MTPFADAAVARFFSDHPPAVRDRLVALRDLILAVAACTPGVGPLEETLKWGQPSYATRETKSGSPIRIDAVRARPGFYAMYFHCQTTLIDTFKRRFGRKFRYEGNRALIFSQTDKLPEAELRACVVEALTYHLRKKKKSRVPIGRRIR